ncbi:MAG: hypothetical protein LBS21_06570, partial [Clostridiales bacterium]|nr:hypothetical protein [Clostridiales bacterium]
MRYHNMRFFAEDSSGNVSEYYEATYNFKNTAPNIPVLNAQPGPMQITLTWDDVTSGEALNYKLYRKDGGKDTLLKQYPVNSERTYTDHYLNPDITYIYYLEAFDKY